MKLTSLIISLLAFLGCLYIAKSQITDCDVLIVGGTTAALGAALSASAYVKTCLLEPTDWVGGQLTAEGLPAIDFAWHTVVDPKNGFTVNVAEINRDLNNRNPTFTQILTDAQAVSGMDNPGRCWVSIVCTTPIDMLGAIQKQVDLRKDNLTIYYNTVVKRVTKDPTGTKILEVEAIQRQSLGNTTEFTFLSEEIEDWYTPQDSAQYNKTILNFAGFKYVADMTTFGEVMVLANASYLQGIAEQYDGDVSGQGGSDTCGQSFAWDFTEYFSPEARDDIPVPNPPNSPPINQSWFGLEGNVWEHIVTYRRVRAQPNETESSNTIVAEDITVQNWGSGNDQKWIYILLSRADAAAQVQDWRGGINMDALIFGEALAVEYHRWFRNIAPAEWANRTVISPESMNTSTGLARIPYLRDSRRSIGIGDFVVTVANITGTAEQVVGTIFEDRVGVGAYDVDIHGNVNCTYPEYMNLNKNKYEVLPYYIPFRALTNRDISNLLVAGKTMATSFLANAAMRLHPEEFTSGQAAGAAMAFGVLNKIADTTGILNQVGELQEFVKQFTPLSWKINGTYYPPENQTLSAEYLDFDILQI